jgi:Bacterial PH domain
VGLPAKLLADGERPLVVLRPHVRRLARPALLLLLLAPFASYAVAAVPRTAVQAPARLVLAALALLVAARWVVLPFLTWWSTLFVLTDERVFERQGVVRRTGHDLPLRAVTDVLVAQRLGERLLRTGTLTVTTGGGRELVLTDVPSVARLQRSLLEVVDQVAQRIRAAHEQQMAEAHELAGEGVGDLEAGLGGVLRDGLGDELDGWDGTGWDLHPWDEARDDEAPQAPSKHEARRRDRETARRLQALQAEVRRGPRPESPVEDDGLGPAPLPAAAAGGHGDGDAHPAEEEQQAEGARILRFPRRP